MRTLVRKFAALILAFLFGAAITVNTAFAREFAIDLKEKVSYVNLDYFDRFGDELLKSYILKAVENNHSARQASYKSEEFRQQVKYSFGAELPSLSVSPTYLGIKGINDGGFAGLPKNTFLLPFIVSYEPDFLLKNRDKTRSVKKIYEGVKFQEQTAYIALASDVATLYVNILKTNKMLELQNEFVGANEKYLAHAQRKLARGTISQSELNDYAARLKRAQADLESIEKSKSILLTQFALLLGEAPGTPNTTYEFGKFEDLIVANAPEEIPSDVIFSRPDVLAIERQLDSAKIDITVARKEFLPRFNLLGSYTFTTIGPGNFFGSNSSIASVLAGATQDIFKGGQKVANLKMKKAKYMELFEQYKQIELQALKDVNDALLQLKFDDKITLESFEELNYQQNSLSRGAKRLSRGVISEPDYLTQKMASLEAAQNHLNQKTNQIIDNFTLYKAVGGKL